MKILIYLVETLLLITAFCCGYYWSIENHDPEIQIETVNISIENKTELNQLQNRIADEIKLKEYYISEAKYYELKYLSENKLDKNPLFEEVFAFIKKDKTDRNLYLDKSRYDCTQFSNTLIRNAFKENILMCAVEINYNESKGHMIVAVNTSDRGLIYIEPQTDKIVELTFGKNKWMNHEPEVIGWDSCFERKFKR